MIKLSNFCIIQEESVVVFVEVPLDPDLGSRKDDVRIILVIELVDEDAGRALTGAVPVLDGGNGGSRINTWPQHNLQGLYFIGFIHHVSSEI